MPSVKKLSKNPHQNMRFKEYTRYCVKCHDYFRTPFKTYRNRVCYDCSVVANNGRPHWKKTVQEVRMVME